MTQHRGTDEEICSSSPVASRGSGGEQAAHPAAGDGETGEPPGPVDTRIGTFHALRYRNYRLLWVGDIFTSAAQWVQQTTVNWLVYDLTNSGSLLGAINLMRMLPTLLLAPSAGVASDRFSRKHIIAIAQMLMAVATLAMAVDILAGRLEVWHLFLFTLLVGAGQTFYMPARQTFVFDLVPRHVIPNAIALAWLAFSLARSVGPAVGGVLIVQFGPANNFLLQAVAYTSVLISVMLIVAPPPPPRTEQKSFFRSLREGYGFAFTHPQARLMVMLSMVSPLFIIPLHAALLPIFAKDVFLGTAGTLGILAGSIGFGGLFGGILTASLNRVERRGLMQLFALLVFAGCETIFCILAYVTGNLWIAVPFLAIAGCAESVYTTSNTSGLQLLAPEGMRGSMASVLQLMFLLMPIGGMIAGAGADLFGAPAVGATMTFMAFCVGVFTLIFSPTMRGLRLSDLVRDRETTG